MLVKDINPGTGHSSPSGFFTHRDLLFFAAYEPSHGIELWQTDGTTEGTRLVADIQNGPGSGLPAGFRRGFNFGDRIFFTASDGLSGEELWAYRPR